MPDRSRWREKGGRGVSMGQGEGRGVASVDSNVAEFAESLGSHGALAPVGMKWLEVTRRRGPRPQ